MKSFENSTERLCSFYVSEWHLVTMILPYINQKLNEKANIITILENNIEENIKILTSKLNLKNEKDILAIDWKQNDDTKVIKKLERFVNQIKDSNIILINGNKQYIDFINQNIKHFLEKNMYQFKNKKIKIINCYEVTEFNNSIREILESHHKILNTSGEKRIEEVFEGYQRKMA